MALKWGIVLLLRRVVVCIPSGRLAQEILDFGSFSNGKMMGTQVMHATLAMQPMRIMLPMFCQGCR